MILATEKLYIGVGLAKVEVQIAAALRAFQLAGEHAGLLGDGGPLAPGARFHGLHLFPGGPVYDSLVNIEEDRPVFRWVFYPPFHLVGLGERFEVDHVPAVFLGGEDFLHGGMAPFGGFHGAF